MMIKIIKPLKLCSLQKNFGPTMYHVNNLKQNNCDQNFKQLFFQHALPF